MVDDMRNALFPSGRELGTDLASKNIQRGRDHGLPDYNSVRKALGLKGLCTYNVRKFFKGAGMLINQFMPSMLALGKTKCTLTRSQKDSHTVESQYNEPIYNEVPGITSDVLQFGQSYSKISVWNIFQYNEIPIITNAIQKPKLKIYLDITNKCHHAPEVECETDQQRWKSLIVQIRIVIAR